MPMQLTITRNRKTSRNYNSEGFGVSLTVELDQSLLSKPKDLQQKIAYLYHEAEEALDKQAQQRNSQGQRNMSAAQRRVIQSIGQRVGLGCDRRVPAFARPRIAKAGRETSEPVH